MDKMPAVVYHGSTTGDLKQIEPRPSRVIDGERAVFATDRRDVAICFLVPWRDNDFRQGSHDGQLYMHEQVAGNFEKFFQGQAGYIYTLNGKTFHHDPRLTKFEAISAEVQPVLGVEHIEDAWAALQGTKFLLIRAADSPPWDVADTKSKSKPLGTAMDKRQFLIEAIQAGAYRRRAWCIKAFSVTKHEPYQLGNPVEPYDIVITSEDKVGIYCIDPTSEMKPVKIEGATQTEPIFQMKDRIKLLPGDLPSVKEEIDTTCGNVLVNAMVLIWPFGDKIPFQVGRINGRKLEAMLASKLHDTPEEGATRDKDKIYVDELIKYCDAMAALGSLATLNVPAASPKILTIDPSVIKRRDELLKENADRLHDAATLAKIEAELVAMDKATMKGDPSEGFMILGKQWDVCRKRQFIMLGAEPGFGETQHGVKPIETSLREGWQVKRMPEMIDNLRSGSYNRGAETAMGGESVKYFYRVFQNTRVAEDDCGSTSGLKWKITEDNFRRFVGLHRADITVKTTDKAAKAEASRLTPEVLKSLIGKTIEVRTPMLCKTQAPSFCARCVGDSLAMTPTGLHIAASDVGSAFMLVFMKKMHGVALKTSRYRYKHSIS